MTKFPKHLNIHEGRRNFILFVVATNGPALLTHVKKTQILPLEFG
jgi:hypothetical protein